MDKPKYVLGRAAECMIAEGHTPVLYYAIRAPGVYDPYRGNAPSIHAEVNRLYRDPHLIIGQELLLEAQY